ncbi:protein containing mandelate racemase/muconate lactonizing enzyme domain [Sulfurimonas gotlandica GD1]|jgi:L-alanine-DL-glutamate epimerase-like enolase superfamily enzyme|uniref:Dipeptide epimerase n=1 Tax=Sulfurimonas gotlandica (strain DSM 19862 / JCM 16533 / GD1) TaxID=929558 RepID=B6BIA7_SULGG|nr:dipeptide epimerase [Sulfurimonas gotlandica]EDZ63455.1 mandelate racemase/muconate lactonizing enzyme [Sulfurimonas gotlandica GD1]EHP30257.1 protein containing mandelate racemase/muconate lactonizing enzyme domain [Sulfurimonas gotlandica GD1]
MKILDISTEVKEIALKTPFITALRRVDAVEFVRVKVVCDDGSVAYGEAPATRAVTGEDIYSILSDIAFIQEELIGLTPKDAIVSLHLAEMGSSAKAALDMALFYLLPQTKEKQNLTLQTDITISLKDSDEMISDATQAIASGMNILKVKFGGDIKHAIEVTNRLSELDAKLIIDANQAWTQDDTMEYLEATLNVKLELIEQPVKADELHELRCITNYSHVPILADESVFTLEDAKAIIEYACADMINIKLMKCGGVTKAIEILEFARKNDIKCMLGSMLEGPISINAALNLAMEYSDVIAYIDLDSPLLYKEPSNELEFDFNGCEITRK